MFIKDGKRFEICNAHVLDGVTYPAQWFMNSANREALGIEEIPDPARMPDETHYNQEIDDAPYLVVTPKPQAMIDAAHNTAIMAQIKSLEASELMPRSVRDLLKKSCEADAAAIGMTLNQVYALAVAQGAAAPEAAKGWKKFKDFDDSINELKKKLR